MALRMRHFLGETELEGIGRRALTCSALALVGLSACQETVLLGTDCKSVDLPCLADSGGPYTPPPPPPGDEVLDAEAASDAQTSPTADFVIENPDFKRGGGIDGDLVIMKTLSESFLRVITDFVTAELPGWYACWPLSVTTESKPISGVSVEMGDYLSFVPSTFNLFDFVPVRQDLTKPLKRGDTVHMIVHAIANSQGANNLYLAVHGTNGMCEPGTGTVLGRSPIIADGSDWQSVCVTFQADDDYTVLMLKPTVEGALPAPTQPQPTLLLDTIELVEACP